MLIKLADVNLVQLTNDEKISLLLWSTLMACVVALIAMGMGYALYKLISRAEKKRKEKGNERT